LNVVHAVAHGGFGRACLYALDRGMVPHAHREGHLIFHLGGPPAEMVVDGESFSLEPGKGVAISPWQPHLCRTLDSCRHVLMLVIYIRPAWFVDATLQTDGDLRFGRVHVAVTQAIGRCVQRIRFLLSEQAGDETSLESCMTDLAVAAHRQTWASRDGGGRDAAFRDRLGSPSDARPHVDVQRAAAVQAGAPRATDFRIRRALRMLDGTLGEQIDLAAVSRAAGLSRPHFFKLFREQIGVPPTIYLNALRLERAIDRLATGEENVAAIGLDLGFSTAASFSRFFAANSVVPPSAYRRSIHARTLQ
jgi:AraC-like DNA-binding protein